MLINTCRFIRLDSAGKTTILYRLQVRFFDWRDATALSDNAVLDWRGGINYSQ